MNTTTMWNRETARQRLQVLGDDAADGAIALIEDTHRTATLLRRDLPTDAMYSRILDLLRDYRRTEGNLTLEYGRDSAATAELHAAAARPLVDAFLTVDLATLEHLLLPDKDGRLPYAPAGVLADTVAAAATADRQRTEILLTHLAYREVWVARRVLTDDRTADLPHWVQLTLRFIVELTAGGPPDFLTAASRIDAAGDDAVERSQALMDGWPGTVDELAAAALLT